MIQLKMTQLNPQVIRGFFGLSALALTAWGCAPDSGNFTETEGSAEVGQLTQAATMADPGFTATFVAGGLTNATAMALAPDGRIFVAEQGGALRVVKNGVLLGEPFARVTVDQNGERGLLGVAFDPEFANNGFVYVYYTSPSGGAHNRIGRFTAAGDTAVAGSEVSIVELPRLSTAAHHNGGALHFAPDGSLYVAVGENGNPANAQDLTNGFGKLLRFNKDGGIPASNPFYSQTVGLSRAIWALGLRNPFTFAIQPTTGALLINDVGQLSWEEINRGVPGANYGWPSSEGATTNPSFSTPVYAYGHGRDSNTGCAITGAAFYNPAVPQFPTEYIGQYFFGDYCSGWIRRLDLRSNTSTLFLSGASTLVDIAVSPSGELYFLNRHSLQKVSYTSEASAPSLASHPQSLTLPVGSSATFAATAYGSTPLSYQWQRDGVDLRGATAQTFTTAPVELDDDGARFRVRVSNMVGSAVSNEAVLTVTDNGAPSPTIVAPELTTRYVAGTPLYFWGRATDPEDGTVRASAYSWRIDFHHGSHVHPAMAEISGVASGRYDIPSSGETSSDVWLRVYFSARDAGGFSNTVYRDVQPLLADVTLVTEPAGLAIEVDGQPFTAPYTFRGVAGLLRSIAAPSPQVLGAQSWAFQSWSDAGAASHFISSPRYRRTYTARFVPLP